MISFELVELKQSNFKWLLINKDKFPITSKVTDIEKELRTRKVLGEILINSYTSSRSHRNEFSSIVFDGVKLKASTWKDIKDPTSEAKLICSNIKLPSYI